MFKRTIIGLLAGAAALVGVAVVATPASAATTVITPKCATTEPPTCDFGETRSAGHYDFQADGLHVWTDDATSQAKVAGYFIPTVPATLEPSVALSMNYSAQLGIEPGKQLVISSGGKTAILVGETVYGDKWWTSPTGCTAIACDTKGITFAGGGGSQYSATLAQWAAAYPGAKVVSFGFSLGSGVHGAGIVKSMTLNGTRYLFQPAVAETTTPPTTSTSVTPPPSTSVTPPTATTTLQGGTGGSATVNNPGQVSVVPNTEKGIKTGDGSLG